MVSRGRKVLIATLALAVAGVASASVGRAADHVNERRPLQAFVVANHGMTTTCPPGPLSCSEAKGSDDVTLLFVSSRPDDGGPAPTGTVTFRDRGAATGETAIDDWVAGYTVRHFGAGSHAVDAVYSGDARYLPMTTATVHLVLSDPETPATTVPRTTTIAPVVAVPPTAPVLEVTPSPAVAPALPTPSTNATTTSTVQVKVKVLGLQITRDSAIPVARTASPLALELLALVALVAVGATMARCGISRRRSPGLESCS